MNKAVVFALAFSVLAAQVAADTMFLKNGQTVENVTVTRMRANNLEFKIAGNETVYTIEKNDLIKIAYDDGTEDVFSAPPPPPAQPVPFPGAQAPAQPAQPAQPVPFPGTAAAVQPAPAPVAQPTSAQPAPVPDVSERLKAWNMSGGVEAALVLGIGGGFYGLEVKGKGNSTFKGTAESPFTGIGFNGFIDAVYGELSLGLTYGSGEHDLSEMANKLDFTFMTIDIRALGKYPVMINPDITIYPLAGFAYGICVSYDGFSNVSASNLSALSMPFGAGFDYRLSPARYARFKVLYNMRFSNTEEKDDIDYFEKQFGSGNITTKAGGGSLSFSAGIGFRF